MLENSAAPRTKNRDLSSISQLTSAGTDPAVSVAAVPPSLLRIHGISGSAAVKLIPRSYFLSLSLSLSLYIYICTKKVQYTAYIYSFLDPTRSGILIRFSIYNRTRRDAT
jgi:hypothetical protein